MSDIKELIKSKLRPIGDAIREKNGSTELIPIDDMPQAIRDIQGGGGGIVEVTELPEVGKANTVYKLIHKNVGTEVPTTGLIENVYLNTSLSIDEVNAILKTIEYIPATNEGEPDIYIVFQTLDSIVRIFDYNNGSYAIMVGMNVAYVSDESFVSAGVTFVGWNPDLTNPCVVYQESTPTDDFVSQNDKLTSLFSVTPFEEEKIPSEMYYLYHKSATVAVPNSGIVENVYFNTELSVEEVNSYLDSITYTFTNEHFILKNEDDSRSIIIKRVASVEPTGYYIECFTNNTDNGWEYVYISSKELAQLYGMDFEGWNPNFNGVYKVDSNVVSTTRTAGKIVDVGSENDKLTSLFSLTPFSYYEQISGGILEVDKLPTSGEDNYVYKIQGVPTAIPYMNVEGVGVVSLIEFAYQKDGTYVEIVDIVESVDKLPTSNIIETTEHEMYGYYVRNDNYYVYGSFGDDGAKIWVTISALIGLPFVGEITNASEITELNSVYALMSGGDSADYYIYEKGEPTQVPNSGYVERVYFNTSLSEDEYYNILKNITFTDGAVIGLSGISFYASMAYMNNSNTYVLGFIKYAEDNIHFGLINFSSMLTIQNFFLGGWEVFDNPYSINSEVLSTLRGLPNGTENDKLINVISTTPYPRWTKISGGGATVKATPEVVPNTGYVERVYLNKSLSFDKVNALVEKANTFMDNDSDVLKWNIIVGTADNKKCLNTSRLSDDDGTTYNAIWFIDATSGISKFTTVWSERNYTSSDGTSSWKKGWNIEEDYIEINSNAEPTSTDDFGTHNHGKYNDQLTELFSINNVFETNEIELSGDYDGSSLVLSNKYVKKTVVPNEGYVERVYFNTSLSIDEVKAILEKFHTYVDVDTLDNAMWLINIDDFNSSGVTPEKLYWIMPSRDTGDYAIVNALAQVIFKSNSSKWAGGDFVGWNPEFITAEKPYLEINSQVFPIVTENGKEIKIGGFNDKIIDLFSLTPFEEKIYDSVEVDIKEMLEEKKLPLSVKVNVESQEPNLQEKEITENGEYVADEGYDGFSKVTVNVESSGSSVSPMKLLLDGRKQANFLFQDFSGESIDDIISYSDTENVTDTTYMFNGCSALTAIPQLDTSNVTNAQYMFNQCRALTEIPQLDTSKVSNMQGMFNNCKALTNLTLLNIKVNLQIGNGTSWGHLLTLESLINTVKELINVGKARTLTMGSANLSKIASTYVKFTDSSVTSIPTNEKGDVVVCELTDEGAMLLSDYALLKNWTLA